MTERGIVLFHTTSAVFRAEKVLAKAGVAVKLIPTPRELSSDCGIAIRFEGALTDQVARVLATAQVEIAGLYCSFPKKQTHRLKRWVGQPPDDLV